MQARDKISRKIKKNGAVSFHEFMEMSLYDPCTGYYTSPGKKNGFSGDYYTSPQLGDAFALMVCRQLEEMWVLLDRQPFTIVEYGAGDGQLCYDILKCLAGNEPLYSTLQYCIIEKSKSMVKEEKALLKDFAPKVKWIQSIKEIDPVCGCILANELVDNFAVHQVVMQQELMEVFVGYDGGFTELLQPAKQELKDYFNRYKVLLPCGYRTEVNLQAEQWMTEIANALKAGFIITIDYGYPAEELYHYSRSSGTMLCYHRHGVNEDPYSNPGTKDITAHINFSALKKIGLQNELSYCGFTSQSYFLLSLGLVNQLRKAEQQSDTSQHYSFLNIQRLMSLSKKIKILILKKNVADAGLLGLQFPLRL